MPQGGVSLLLFRHAKTRGFSIIEILLAVAIVTILSVPTVQSFRGIQARKVLDNDVALVATTLEQARSLTLASKNEKPYGVHVESGSVTLFETATFVNGSSTNSVSGMSSATTLSHTLAGGGADVVFQRLTGKTTQSGTITVTHQSAGAKTITIHSTGVTEVQ